MQKPPDCLTALRLTFIRRHPLYVSHYQRLKKLEQSRIFCRHQTEHLLDTARIAYILNLEEGYGLSRDLIYAAALLHDIGKSLQYEEGTPHEQAGAALAGQILSDMPAELTFTMEEQWQILTAIRVHRRLRNEAEPLESLLYRGDKLSRPCFSCPAASQCDWSDEKKNMEIYL